jgi:hypothetical protein
MSQSVSSIGCDCNSSQLELEGAINLSPDPEPPGRTIDDGNVAVMEDGPLAGLDLTRREAAREGTEVAGHED